MKNKIVLLFACIFLCMEYANAQIIDSVLWVTFPSEIIVYDSSYTSSNDINEIFAKQNVSSIIPVFPFAKSKFLQNTYQVNCNSAEGLYNEIQKNIGFFTYCDFVYEEVPMYDPSDWMWYNTVSNNITDGWLWYLVKINASQAWDITRGDPNVKIAVVDIGNVDYNHPELITKIDPLYDFYYPNSSTTPPSDHPTVVSSLLAAETADVGETPQGSMASIGYKSKIMYSKGGLSACLYASTVLGAEILSISWYYQTCAPSSYLLETEQEILDNGTLIVRAAGNGIEDCNGNRLYPFSGYEDDRVIVVSSTDFNDNHTNGTDTHSHYAEVDICAPGYHVMGAMPSIDSNGDPVSWPYYGSCSGTSFATPIVSGVAALIKSVNRCLSPADIQYIIKTTADPIADASQYPGLVGAGRINAYQAVLMAKSYSDTVFISSNTTWASERKVHGHIVIEPNATLTVTNTLKLGKDVKIIIEPAGKLVVDGGTITNLCCDDLWYGIRVIGDKNLRQLSQYQGTLEIKNGALIENARTAISTWDGEHYSTSGGIVQCINSIFRNNRRCVEFMAYTNHNSSNSEIDNVSYFTKCNFIVDDNNMFAANNATFSNFITMWGVRGIKLNGCTFDDQCATPHTTCHAIGTADAGYTINEYCQFSNPQLSCDCLSTPVRSSVKNVAMGAEASNTGTNYLLKINRTDFESCGVAAYITAINNFRFTENSVNMPLLVNAFNWDAYGGLYSTNSSGYKIEGNNFYCMGQPVNLDFYNLGVQVVESGSDYNTIYRNTFDKLEYGIMSENNSGLQLQCNDFTSSFAYDIYIDGGVSPAQGSYTKSAGNKFTTGVSNIYVVTSNALTYYYSGTASPSNVYNPVSTYGSITKIANATANDCASTLCNIIIPPINPPIIDPIVGPKSAPMNGDITLYESLQQIYESRLADYNAAGYDFLLENFEDGDADIVATARLMQDTLISLRRAMAEIANRNIDAILQDTVVFDRESLNGWYNRINTQTAKYSLINSYFEMGEYALARQELAAIPQRFALTADELAEYDNFCQYQSLREAVYTDGRNYAQLTEDEIAELQVIVERNTGVSSAYANSVLCFFYGICRDDELDFDIDIDAPMNSKSTTAVSEESTNEEPLAIYVYPNPADNELNVLFNSLPEGRTTIEFHDVAGRMLLTQEITSTNARIDISSLPQGVYMCRIVNGDNIIARDRIVKE